MDNIYDTLAKLNKVANRPEAKKIVKEDSNGMMRKGLKDLINKSSKMNKQSNYTPFSDKQSPDGLPEKKKDNKMFEKESDVERDDRAEKAGREVKRDAKYDDRRHAGKDGKDVTGDIEYDEKHDKDGMHEASKTMVKGPDGKMVPDYAVDGKGKHDMKEGGSLKDAARAGVMARLAELAGLPATEIEEALGDSPEDTASRIMSEVSLDEEDKMPMDAGEDDESVKEEDTNEGNEFSGALEDAKENGKSEFTVDGKKYKVEAIDSDEDAIQEGGGRDMECGHCDGTGKHGDKDCKKCDGTGEAQDDDDPMNNESKVEETTSAGAVADGAGSGSSPYKNASVYESNEIVKRAKQINEDMSFTVSGGPDQEPTLNINASGEEATQLAQLLKLSGLAMTAQQPSYGEVEIQVAEDQEFANGDQNEQTADTNTLVNAISGGLNGQKKMAYPRASQGDNAMATLGESELVATSANQLLKQYEAFKAK